MRRKRKRNIGEMHLLESKIIYEVYGGKKMKLGVITDIHNNLIALKAVVEKLNQQNCDKIICCGDIIGIGPYPEETVQFMIQIPNLIAIRGNHETYLLEGMPSEVPNEEQMDFGEMEHHKWEHSMLSKKSVEFLKGLPYRTEFECEGYRLTVMHYCMDEKGHYIRYKTTPAKEDLKQMFAEGESDMILYGHDHGRTICKGDKVYVNVGSLGCPGQEKNIARAGIVTIEKGSIEVQAIDVEYDVDKVISAIDEIKYPDAENIKKYFYGLW